MSNPQPNFDQFNGAPVSPDQGTEVETSFFRKAAVGAAVVGIGIGAVLTAGATGNEAPVANTEHPAQTCDPQTDPGCTPDTSGSLPELTKPSVVDTTKPVDTTTTEKTTTTQKPPVDTTTTEKPPVDTTTTIKPAPAPTVPATHESRPPNMPPMTVHVTPGTPAEKPAPPAVAIPDTKSREVAN